MNNTPSSQDPLVWITDVVRAFCDGPENRLYPAEAALNQAPERAWGEPLLGVSSGNDPVYAQLETAVGPFHWTPQEAFALAFPDTPVRAEELSVICWVLPQTPATRQDNRAQTRYPAERWARSRIYGEEFNNRLRGHVADALVAQGYPAVAPVLLPQWRTVASDPYVFASTWSERHAAYASGLGTFGLCDGLITPLGKAVRLGSVVARITLAATPRPYAHHRAYCPFYATPRACGRCIARCPAGALSEHGHDKTKCRAYAVAVVTEYVKTHYGFDGYGCGLCQTGVPCESRIPGA